MLPFLSQEVRLTEEFVCLIYVINNRFLLLQHQQQVASAVERAKQVTMTELNAVIGVRILKEKGIDSLALLVVALSIISHAERVRCI